MRVRRLCEPRMWLGLTALEASSEAVVHITVLIRIHAGMTRKFIGATFEGQTRDAEGMVWTECDMEGEGITREVSACQQLARYWNIHPKADMALLVSTRDCNVSPREELTEISKTDYLHRVIASTKAEGGWNIGIGCSTRDPIDLLDPVKFVEFFHKFTGRSDIVLKDMVPPRHWK